MAGSTSPCLRWARQSNSSLVFSWRAEACLQCGWLLCFSLPTHTVSCCQDTGRAVCWSGSPEQYSWGELWLVVCSLLFNGQQNLHQIPPSGYQSFWPCKLEAKSFLKEVTAGPMRPSTLPRGDTTHTTHLDFSEDLWTLCIVCLTYLPEPFLSSL